MPPDNCDTIELLADGERNAAPSAGRRPIISVWLAAVATSMTDFTLPFMFAITALPLSILAWASSAGRIAQAIAASSEKCVLVANEGRVDSMVFVMEPVCWKRRWLFFAYPPITSLLCGVLARQPIPTTSVPIAALFFHPT